MQGEDAVRFGDVSLPVLRGRPDIPAALRGAAAEASRAVGVYAGGERRRGLTCRHIATPPGSSCNTSHSPSRMCIALQRPSAPPRSAPAPKAVA